MMSTIDGAKKLVVQFLCDESGQATSEFRNALVLALLSAVLIVGLVSAVHNGQLTFMSDSARTQLRSIASAGQIY